MLRKATVPCFAKLNLSLSVLYKRPDAYHELRTVFQTISLADELAISYEAGRATAVEAESTVVIENNLVVRAARAVIEAARIKGRVRFRLEKRIPLGAGMGGGSSDAAAVLIALPVLAGKPVPTERLLEIAADLGSDVPFFLRGGTSLGVSRGEELYPLPEAAEEHVLIVVPPVAVSTADAYKALGRRPVTELTPADWANKMKRFQQGVWGLECPEPTWSWKAFSENDFEAAVFPRYPILPRLFEQLRECGARPARMSGSGSALFGVFPTRQKAQRAERALKAVNPGGNVEIVRFLSRGDYRAAWRQALGSLLKANTSWPLAQ